MWKDLNIQQKSEVMKMAISQGLTDLNEIKKMYDASIPNIEASSVNNTYSSVPYNPSPKDVRYDDGGWLNYLKWKDAIGKYKGIDTNDPAYDYAGFYIENPKRAWALLNDDPNAHFVDTYKTVYHPTFSDESMYSGMVSPQYNPEGLIGGSWRKYPDSFTMSTDLYRSPVSIDERIQYLENNEPEGIVLREYDGSLPMFNDGSLWGGVKPTVEVSPHAYGGPLGNIYQGKGNKSQKLSKAEIEFLYLDPSMSFFDALTKAGVHFKTSNPSGYRSPAQQKAMGFKTKDSQHSHKRDDGTAWALDIVPAKGYTFADLQRELTHPALQVYFRNNGLGVYDETTQEVLAKTGGTGPHYHVGRNKFGPKGSMAITYNNWIKKYNPALPEAYRMPIDLVEVSPEQSVYHHPANDLVWNPPTTEITPEDLNREIAPLLMQDNKPLIVEPLNNSEPSKSFDDIWDQIFPKVENTQEEFNPLLDPSTQFTALQSRPRYQMKPTPIINMPVSNGDNDYMLFRPLT